jgi:hypothetical protein
MGIHWDGWRQGTLDDASFLGSAINFVLWEAARLMGSVFHRKKKSILLGRVCVPTIHLII